MSTKLSVFINDETAAYVRERVEREGITVTEAIRRIFVESKFLNDQKQAGNMVIVRKKKRVWSLRTTEHEIQWNF